MRRPLAAFFTLTSAFSWACWAVPAFGYRDGAGAALFLLGSFGPLVGAATTTWLLGGSVRSWFKGVFRWRVPLRWYAFAFLVPPTLAVLVTLEFRLAGETSIGASSTSG